MAPKNRLTCAWEARKAAGLFCYDLTSPVSGAKEIAFPSDALEAALRSGLAASRPYRPESAGQGCARGAIAEYYRRREEGKVPDALEEHVFLSPGSSLSCLFLFRLLTEAGDEILVPEPSYPLLDQVAQLAGIRLSSYPLRETNTGWVLDAEELENRVTTKTKAILIVSPHNPTGWVLSKTDADQVAAIAERFRLAVLHDEVFADFYVETKGAMFFHTAAPLVFTLHGISKMLLLPEQKLSWVLVSGEGVLVKDATQRLEHLMDAFLPVAEPIQFALPSLLSKAGEFSASVRNLVLRRIKDVHQVVKRGEFEFLPPQGGFQMVLRLEENVDEESLAISILEQTGFLLHPGAFYDMRGSHLIASVLHPEEVWRRAMQEIPRWYPATSKRI